MTRLLRAGLGIEAVVLMTILFTLSIGLIDQPRKIAAGVLAGSTGFPSSSVRSADLLAQYVVVLKDGVDSSAVASVHALIYGAQVSHVYRYALNGYAATIPTSAIPALESDLDVLFVSKDSEVFAAGEPTMSGQMVS